MKNKLIYIALFIIFLVSCEKEIAYKGKDKDPVLVLNGLIEIDSTFRIYLERSFFFLSDEDPSDKFIKSGATITLTNLSSGEIFTMTNSTNENCYDFPFISPENTKFKIEIQHPDYETIKSEMTTNHKIEIISVDTSSFTNTNGLQKRAKIKWNDPLGENYYFLRVYSYDPEFGYKYNTWFSSSDPSLTEGIDPALSASNSQTDEVYFNDILFDNKEKILEINFDIYYGSSQEYNPIYTYELITLNKEAFKYIQSVKKYLYGDNFLSEPIKVYSNIENGFGIFGSTYTSRYTK
jgi:hypothetical protein